MEHQILSNTFKYFQIPDIPNFQIPDLPRSSQIFPGSTAFFHSSKMVKDGPVLFRKILSAEPTHLGSILPRILLPKARTARRPGGPAWPHIHSRMEQYGAESVLSVLDFSKVLCLVFLAPCLDTKATWITWMTWIKVGGIHANIRIISNKIEWDQIKWIMIK